MTPLDYIPLLMFATVCVALMAGYPVAFTLAGVAMLFAGGGILAGLFDPNLLLALPGRIYGTMTNTTLIAVPLFIFMGVVMERSQIAESLLRSVAALFGRLPGGLGFGVIAVGTLMAASTGVVGATVVTMGLLSLPTMLARGYDPKLAAGVICATGTLGQIIPPSIVLLLLGDVLGTAYQQAQLRMNVLHPQTLSVGDLFVGAIVPGMILVLFYLLYVAFVAWRRPQAAPAFEVGQRPRPARLLLDFAAPVVLIVAVLGSIMSGAATPAEAAGVGAFGALLMAAARRQLTLKKVHEAGVVTLEMTCMVFVILLGATVFSLVFRGFGGEEMIAHLFDQLPGGTTGAVIVVMLAIFLLGFILDFIEIAFVVVPIVAPVLMMMGVDPLWLGIMIAVNLQTSFLTPPFGFALFYLRGVAPPSLRSGDIYRGAFPFIGLQLLLLIVLTLWPGLVSWLPALLKS